MGAAASNAADWLLDPQSALIANLFTTARLNVSSKAGSVLLQQPVMQLPVRGSESWQCRRKHVYSSCLSLMRSKWPLQALICESLSCSAQPSWGRYRSFYLQRIGLHQHSWWRRDCACFGHVPYGLLPATEGPVLSEQVLQTPLVGGQLITSWSEYMSARALPADSPMPLLLHFALSTYWLLLHVFEVGSPIVQSTAPLDGRSKLRIDLIGPERELDLIDTLR